MASHGHAGAVESRFASGHLLFGSDVRGTAKTWNSFLRESPRGIYLSAALDIAIIICYFFYFFSNARKLPCELKLAANPCNSFFRSSGFTFLEWVCSFVLLITLKFCTIQTDIHVCICFFFNWRVNS